MNRMITLAAALLLAGCASSPPLETLPPVPVHSPAPAATEAPQPVPVVTPEPITTEYLSSMRTVYDFTGVPDSQLLEAGQQVCDTLDLGITVTGLAVELAATEDLDSELAGVMLAGAVTFLCPEYTAQLEAFIGATS